MVSVGLFGGMGTGKTALGVALLGENIRRGGRGFGNIHIAYPDYSFLPVSEMLSFKSAYNDCSMFGDEWYLVTESRRSGGNTNLGASYVRFQSRKRGQDFFYTAQVPSSVDLRDFLLTELKWACYGLNPDTNCFEYDLSVEGRIVPLAVPVEWFEFVVFPFYDTCEIVEPLGLDCLIAEIEKRTDLEKFNRRLDLLCDDFLRKKGIKGFKELKKFEVNDFCVRLGYPEFLASYAFDRLRSESSR